MTTIHTINLSSGPVTRTSKTRVYGACIVATFTEAARERALDNNLGPTRPIGDEIILGWSRNAATAERSSDINYYRKLGWRVEIRTDVERVTK